MKLQSYGIALYKGSKILLCRGSEFDRKWGFVKGMREIGESIDDCAIREFFEESSIKIEKKFLEDFYFQENDEKDIGIYLVNYYNIKDIDKYFENERLKEKYLNWENYEIKFFDIANLPKIKKKQTQIAKQIVKKWIKS